jgi:putative component of membrane protein insertase Oxa1/YidC/SpoIIIJ protein YidD
MGMVWQAFRCVQKGTPRVTVLRMIEWYQINVSAGRNRCSRPAPYNCSSRAAWFIRSYGLLVGGMFAFWVVVMGECSDGPGEDRGNCCGGGDHS